MTCKDIAQQLRNICCEPDTLHIIKEASDILEKLEKDFLEVIKKSEDICDYCKHQIECKKKECSEYVEGQGCTDQQGNYYDWKWSCLDLNFGECPLLENTPCNKCTSTDDSGFQWRGTIDMNKKDKQDLDDAVNYLETVAQIYENENKSILAHHVRNASELLQTEIVKKNVTIEESK